MILLRHISFSSHFRDFLAPQQQIWLRDEIFSGSRIPISSTRDRDFLLWARSKNPENLEKIPKNPEYIIPKTQNYRRSRSWFEIPRKSRENFDSGFFLISVFLSSGFEIFPGFFYFRDIPRILIPEIGIFHHVIGSRQRATPEKEDSIKIIKFVACKIFQKKIKNSINISKIICQFVRLKSY